MPLKTRLPFYNPLDPTHPKIWPDYTLVMPLCAVGNIGQLASDLIISTLLAKHECQLVGRIYSPALMPVVGPNAFQGPKSPQATPTSSTEVYESRKYKLLIIQQRTSYFKNLKHIYIQELIRWIKDSQFDQFLVLSSSFAQCNPDTSQLDDPTSCSINSLTTSSFDQQNDKWKRLSVKPIPDKRTIKVVEDGLTFLPGSGLTRALLKACEKAFIPAAFLVDFCSEGININDCYQVANLIDSYLGLGCSGVSCTAERAPGDGHQSDADVDGGDFRKLSGWIEPYSWTQAQC